MSASTAKFAQYVRFKFTPEGGTLLTLDFEASAIVVGFEEKRQDFELINGNLIQEVEYYRFFLSMSTPWLRRGPTAGSYDFLDVIEALDAGTSVTVEVPQYSSTAYAVVKASEGIQLATQKQRVIPALDYSFRATATVSSLPAWIEYTRAKPGYL